MNQHVIRYIANEDPAKMLYSRKSKETYISPNKDIRFNIQKERIHTSPTNDNQEVITSRNAPFQRTRNRSNEKNDKSSPEGLVILNGGEDKRREALKFSQIRKKLDQEMRQRERLQELNANQSLKLSNLGQQISKFCSQKKELQKAILELKRTAEESMQNFVKAQQTIDQLTRSLKEAQTNQKNLSNLKNLQNQMEYLQQRNKKLSIENEELVKKNKIFKNDLERLTTKDSTSESDSNPKMRPKGKKDQIIEPRRLLGEIALNKNQREYYLEATMHDLEKKLYDKDNMMKKLQIQLNYIDRKKILSIDEVRNKKDQEIKHLRQKFMKVTKDLRQTKDKFEKNQKKQSIKGFKDLYKVKSSRNFDLTSQSSEITFQLSSETLMDSFNSK